MSLSADRTQGVRFEEMSIVANNGIGNPSFCAGWQNIGDRLPPAHAGEAGFAASGTCAATQGGERAWLGTGAAEARVLATTDGGDTWQLASHPTFPGDLRPDVRARSHEDRGRNWPWRRGVVTRRGRHSLLLLLGPLRVTRPVALVFQLYLAEHVQHLRCPWWMQQILRNELFGTRIARLADADDGEVQIVSRAA